MSLACRLTALLLAALALAGCGGGARSGGEASLWITKDEGASVVLEADVPAGQTLLRALRSKSQVDTRYGGRFVQSIEGLSGSLSKRYDWFWLVNGYVGSTSAAEYRLRDGDIAWWDYRDWSKNAEEIEIVPGAFPEPFVHGFGGRVRPTSVRFGPGAEKGARRIAERIGAGDVAARGTAVPDGSHLIEVDSPGAQAAVSARLRSPGKGPGAPVRLVVTGPVDGLLSGAFARTFGS